MMRQSDQLKSGRDAAARRTHLKIIEPLERRRLLSAVQFDSQFAGGYAALPPNPSSRVADTAVEQANGKIIVVGHTHPKTGTGAISITRYNANGSIDSTYNAGKPVIADPTPLIDAVDSATLQADGKLLVVSESQQEDDQSFQVFRQAYRVLRINTDGTLDSTFGTGGISAVVGGANDNFVTLLITPAGNIDFVTSGGLLQLTATGKIDSTFGTRGLAQTQNQIEGAAVADGGLVFVQNVPFKISKTHIVGDLVLNKLTFSGKADNSFGTRDIGRMQFGARFEFAHNEFYLQSNNGNGDVIVVTLDGRMDKQYGSHGVASGLDSFAVSADGQLVSASPVEAKENAKNQVIGETPGAIKRFTVHGKPDPGFGSAGKIQYSLPGSEFKIAQIIPQADGKVLLAGTADDPNAFVLLRFTAAGAPDKSFGKTGVVRSISADTNGDNSIIVSQPDGRIVVGGTLTSATTGKSQLLFERRFLDGSIDSSFSVDSFLAHHFQIDQLDLLADGAFMASGDLNGKPTVARITSAGKLDPLLDGKGYMTVATTLMATGPDGRFVIADGTSVRRYHSDGTLDKNFGQQGIAMASAAGDSSHFSALKIDLQSDGKVVLTGSAHVTEDGQTFNNGENIVRLTAGGKADRSFGTIAGGGISILPEDELFIGPTAVGPSDEIYNLNFNVDGFPTLFGYDSNGHAKPRFGDPVDENSVDLRTVMRFADAMTVQPDGKVVIVGDGQFADGEQAPDEVEVLRLNSDGSKDQDFYFSGSRTIDATDFENADAVAVANNGDLIVAGQANTGPEYDPPLAPPRRLLLRIRGNSVAGSVGIGQDNQLWIAAGPSNDTLTASSGGGKLRVLLNGKSHTFATSAVDSIIARMGAGNDLVNLGKITIDSQLFGQDGNDSLTGGAGIDNLDGGAGDDVLRGGV